jgi:hypothetical protein
MQHNIQLNETLILPLELLITGKQSLSSIPSLIQDDKATFKSNLALTSITTYSNGTLWPYRLLSSSTRQK